jgi:hypothetical protein
LPLPRTAFKINIDGRTGFELPAPELVSLLQDLGLALVPFTVTVSNADIQAAIADDGTVKVTVLPVKTNKYPRVVCADLDTTGVTAGYDVLTVVLGNGTNNGTLVIDANGLLGTTHGLPQAAVGPVAKTDALTLTVDVTDATEGEGPVTVRGFAVYVAYT